MALTLVIGAFVLGQAMTDDLRASARLWQEMGAPVLSSTSRPFLIHPGPNLTGSKKYPPLVGFTDPEGARKGVFLYGTRLVSSIPDGESIRTTSWTNPATYNERDWWLWDSRRRFIVNPNVCAVVVSEIAGHHEFAESLLQKIKRPNPATIREFEKSHYWPIASPSSSSLLAYTAEEILTQLVNQTLEPGSDRKLLLQKIQKLVSLGLVKADSHQQLPRIVHGLKALPDRYQILQGAAENYIFRLCEMQEGDRYLGTPWVHEKSPKRMLLAFGLQSVPSLISHLDDDRPTRTFDPGVMLQTSRIVTVGDVCRELLVKISKGKIASSSEHFTKQDARKWYLAKNAQQMKSYLKRHALLNKRTRGL